MKTTLTIYDRAANVTPNDTADLPIVDAGFTHAQGLLIGGAGSLKVTLTSGDIVAIPNVVAGFLRLAVRRVWATGTTATGIVALA